MAWITPKDKIETAYDIRKRLIGESLEMPGRYEHFKACLLKIAEAAGTTLRKGASDKEMKRFVPATMDRWPSVFRPLTEEADEEPFDPFEDDDEAKTCTFKESVLWVLAFLGDFKSLKPSDAPSRVAYKILRWTDKADLNETDFMKSFVAKMIPSQKDIDDEERRGKSSAPIIEETERQIDAILTGSGQEADIQEEEA